MSKQREEKKPEPAKPDPITTGEHEPTGAQPARLRQNLPPPLCPYHKVACKCNRSDPFFTRYYCPEEGCTFSQKIARPQIDKILKRREAQEEDFSAR